MLCANKSFHSSSFYSYCKMCVINHTLYIKYQYLKMNDSPLSKLNNLYLTESTSCYFHFFCDTFIKLIFTKQLFLFCMLLQDITKIFLHNVFPVFFQMYRFLPGFDYLVWNILERNNILFANDKK